MMAVFPSKRLVRATLLLIASSALLITVDAQSYTNPHDLVLEDRVFSSAVYIMAPTGSVTIRRCQMKSTLRINGNITSYKENATEITILIEDTIAETALLMNYFTLVGNSSITVRNVNDGSRGKGYTNFQYLITDGVPLSFVNVTQSRYFYFRYSTLGNGSSLNIDELNLPTEGAHTPSSTGQFRTQSINVVDGSEVVVNKLRCSSFMFSGSAMLLSSYTVQNSYMQSDSLCRKTNCDKNVSSIAMNRASFNVINTTLHNATLRVSSMSAINSSTLLIKQSTIEHWEISDRSSYAMVVSSSSTFDTNSTLRFEDSTLLQGPLDPNNRLSTSRTLYLQGSVKRSHVVMKNCTLLNTGKSSKVSVYIFGVTSGSTISIDTVTFDRMNGAAYMIGVDDLAQPLVFNGIHNPGLNLYLRGSIGKPINATGAVLKRLEVDAGIFDTPDAFIVQHSTISIIRLDTNTIARNGANVLIRNTVTNSFQLEYFSLVLGASLQVENVTVKSIFDWETGSIQTSSVIINGLNLAGAMKLQASLRDRGQFVLANSSVGKGIDVSGVSLDGGSLFQVSDSLIANSLVAPTNGPVGAITYQSATITDSSLIFENNVIQALRVSTLSPNPIDRAYGVFLEATVSIMGSSAVSYVGNTISTEQNGANGTSIAHDAVTMTKEPIIYIPPAKPHNVNISTGEIVEIRLDGNATLDADWCSMWDIDILRIKLINPGRPLVLDGADARGVASLVIDCGGGSGAVPVYITNSRFNELVLTRCIVGAETPFILEDSHLNGTFVWGPTSVPDPVAAILFNATLVGGMSNPLPGIPDPAIVDRPPAVLKELLMTGLGNATRWNERRCFPDAPPFSYTPSASISGTPSPTDSNPRSTSVSLPPTPTTTGTTTKRVTQTVSTVATESMPPTNTHEITVTRTAEKTITTPLTATHAPTPSTSISGSKSKSASSTVLPPPPTPSKSHSPTISTTESLLPCGPNPSGYNASITTVDEGAFDGESDVTVALKGDQHVLHLAAVIFDGKLTPEDPTATIPSKAYEIDWRREQAGIPSYLVGGGTLPSVGAQLKLHLNNDTGIYSLSLTFRLNLVLTSVFEGVYPSDWYLRLLPDYFHVSHCNYTADIAAILVIPTPDKTAEKMSDFLEGSGLLTTLSAVVVGAAPAGAPIGLAILGDMECSRPMLRASTRNRWLLSPAAFDDSLTGALHGSLMLMVVVPLLHALATYLLASHKDALEVPLVAMAITRFPSLTFGVMAVLHPGLTFISLKFLLHSGHTPGETGAAVFGLVFAIVIPMVFVFFAKRYVDGVYVHYDYEDTPAVARPASMWQRILPRGRWEVVEMRRAFGVMLAPFEKSNPLWACFLFAPSMISVVAVASPSTAAGCSRQFGLIAGLALLYVVVIAVCRPFRANMTNVLAGVVAFFFFIVALITALEPISPDNSPVMTRSATSAMIVFTMIAIFLWLIHFLIVFVMEHRIITSDVVLRPLLYRVAGDPIFPCFTRPLRQLPNSYFVPAPLSTTINASGRSSRATSRGPKERSGKNITDVGMLMDDDILAQMAVRPDHDDMTLAEKAEEAAEAGEEMTVTPPTSLSRFNAFKEDGSDTSGGYTPPAAEFMNREGCAEPAGQSPANRSPGQQPLGAQTDGSIIAPPRRKPKEVQISPMIPEAPVPEDSVESGGPPIPHGERRRSAFDVEPLTIPNIPTRRKSAADEAGLLTVPAGGRRMTRSMSMDFMFTASTHGDSPPPHLAKTPVPSEKGADGGFDVFTEIDRSRRRSTRAGGSAAADARRASRRTSLGIALLEESREQIYPKRRDFQGAVVFRTLSFSL